MLSLQKNIAQSLLLLTVIPTVLACSKSKFTATQAPAVKPVQQTNNPRPGYPTDPVYDCRKNNTCYQPPKPTHPTPPTDDCVDYDYDYSNSGPKTVHVWISMDGSKSNVNERYKQLTGLLEMYESLIARQIPIKVAVITGHSPESYHSPLRGHNFFKVTDSEPNILRFDYTAGTRRNNFALLKNKILNMETDNSRGISDGGELLTANVMAVIRNNQYRRLMKMETGDILNIHFIGDENDACTIGTEASTPPLRGLPIYAGEQGLSSEEIARRRHCMKDIPGKSINMNVTDGGRGYSQTLANALVELNSQFNLHMSAFVYTGEGLIPAGTQNEIGHGIVDLLAAVEDRGVNSKVFDLASLSVRSGNSEADVKLSVQAAGAAMMEGINNSVHPKVQMKDKDGTAIDVRPEYIQSVSVDGKEVGYAVEASGYVKLNRGCPGTGKKITVRYCKHRR